eukprot:2441661-Amphidinium_carterae.1
MSSDSLTLALTSAHQIRSKAWKRPYLGEQESAGWNTISFALLDCDVIGKHKCNQPTQARQQSADDDDYVKTLLVWLLSVLMQQNIQTTFTASALINTLVLLLQIMKVTKNNWQRRWWKQDEHQQD